VKPLLTGYSLITTRSLSALSLPYEIKHYSQNYTLPSGAQNNLVTRNIARIKFGGCVLDLGEFPFEFGHILGH